MTLFGLAALVGCRAFESDAVATGDAGASSDAGATASGTPDAAADAAAPRFCARHPGAMACRDFDDGEHGLATSLDTVDAEATLRVNAQEHAPSKPNVLRSSADGVSLEAFGQLVLPTRPTLVAFKVRVTSNGAIGELARVVYGGAMFGLRAKPGSPTWEVFTSVDNDPKSGDAVQPVRDQWLSVEYRITDGAKVTVVVNGKPVATDTAIPPMPAGGGATFNVGIAEADGPWVVEFDDILVQ